MPNITLIVGTKTLKPRFRNRFTGMEYAWVDLTTAMTGIVKVHTPAGSTYNVLYESLEEIS